MALRTPTLFAALAAEGALDVLVALLQWPDGAGVGAIQEAAELPQATVTRRLQDLAASDLVEHGRRGPPYRIREPEGVAALVSTASELSERLLALDAEAERALRARFASAPKSG